MAWDKKWGENRKKKRAERKAKGFCPQCGESSNGLILCGACNEKKVETLRISREKAKGQGVCQNCFKNKTGGGFYCDECYQKQRVARELRINGGERICQTEECNKIPSRHAQYCDGCIERREAETQSCKVYFPTCPDCKTLFTVRTRQSNQRCEQCSIKRWNKKATERNRTKHGLKLLKKICAHCGGAFKTYRGRKNTCGELCSKRLMKQAENNRRRAERYGSKHIEKVEIATLFFRDNGRCQICNRKLNLDRAVPHKMAATIDHVVPLSLGGEHSYKNTQLACFMCNSIKGNRTVEGGEQMLLFGV